MSNPRDPGEIAREIASFVGPNDEAEKVEASVEAAIRAERDAVAAARTEAYSLGYEACWAQVRDTLEETVVEQVRGAAMLALRIAHAKGPNASAAAMAPTEDEAHD